MTAYPNLATHATTGCVCKEARFDVDGYGRLYIPSAFDYCMQILDNAANELARIGCYGNADSQGPLSRLPEPPIALGWPFCVSAGQMDKGRMFIADMLNHRVVRLHIVYKAQQVVGAE